MMEYSGISKTLSRLGYGRHAYSAWQYQAVTPICSVKGHPEVLRYRQHYWFGCNVSAWVINPAAPHSVLAAFCVYFPDNGSNRRARVLCCGHIGSALLSAHLRWSNKQGRRSRRPNASRPPFRPPACLPQRFLCPDLRRWNRT